MNLDEIKSKIETALPGTILKQVRDSLLIENPADLSKVASYLKLAPEFRLDYLSSLTGADYLTYLEVVYHLYSMEQKTGPVVLRVRTADRANPRVPSLVQVYRSAEYQEREAYDLYGIIFENHPDLRRMFMWEGFAGFPLRKDYVQEDTEWLEHEDLDWLEKHGVKVTDEMRKKASEPRVVQKPTGEM